MLRWAGDCIGSAMASPPIEPGLRQRLVSGRKESRCDLREDAEQQLKRFIETNGHFSLVRYVALLTDPATFTSPMPLR